ncbi:unnamed protein product [Owenia fusiformis]|uniref:Uncharacterized protein n=1 Tax=Owenia fusiformis TaxID=6347 RepID=A0A8J1Y9X6_OWEFU|nr:unnamed protein product [Owenia fusiformis]
MMEAIADKDNRGEYINGIEYEHLIPYIGHIPKHKLTEEKRNLKVKQVDEILNLGLKMLFFSFVIVVLVRLGQSRFADQKEEGISNAVVIVVHNTPDSTLKNIEIDIPQNPKYPSPLNRYTKIKDRTTDLEWMKSQFEKSSIVYMAESDDQGAGREKRSLVPHDTVVTEEEIKIILDTHNTARRKEGSSNMEYLRWNAELADLSQGWAENCDWEHGQVNYSKDLAQFNPIGQNLYFTTGRFNLAAGIEAWYKEKRFYNYDTLKCSWTYCGHYTQVVWAKSREIGCGYHTCETMIESSKPGKIRKNAKYLVCNYGPAGNYRNQKPFKKGTECTKCSGGSYFCDKGLCRDCEKDGMLDKCVCMADCNCGYPTQDCRCQCQDGWNGNECLDVCKNKHKYCTGGWPKSYCTSNKWKGYMKNVCPGFCGHCKIIDGLNDTSPCPLTTSAPTTAATTSAETNFTSANTTKTFVSTISTSADTTTTFPSTISTPAETTATSVLTNTTSADLETTSTSPSTAEPTTTIFSESPNISVNITSTTQTPTRTTQRPLTTTRIPLRTFPSTLIPPTVPQNHTDWLKRQQTLSATGMYVGIGLAVAILVAVVAAAIFYVVGRKRRSKNIVTMPHNTMYMNSSKSSFVKQYGPKTNNNGLTIEYSPSEINNANDFSPIGMKNLPKRGPTEIEYTNEYVPAKIEYTQDDGSTEMNKTKNTPTGSTEADKNVPIDLNSKAEYDPSITDGANEYVNPNHSEPENQGRVTETQTESGKYKPDEEQNFGISLSDIKMQENDLYDQTTNDNGTERNNDNEQQSNHENADLESNDDTKIQIDNDVKERSNETLKYGMKQPTNNDTNRVYEKLNYNSEQTLNNDDTGERYYGGLPTDNNTEKNNDFKQPLHNSGLPLTYNSEPST